MGHDPSGVALGLKVWKTQIDRAGKLFGKPLVRGRPAGHSTWQE
jgi:hypothetical protein